MGVTVRRRDFSWLLGSAPLAFAFRANAQQPGKIPVVGVLWHAGSEKEEEPWFGWLRQAFAEVGYISGKTIIFEDRYPAEIPDRFDNFAADLLRFNVDVIVTNTFIATFGCQESDLNHSDCVCGS